MAEWRRLLLLVVGLMVLGYLSSLWILPTDVTEYARYAAAALVHPGQAWPREYPPVALFVFLLPVILPIPYTYAFPIIAGALLAVLLLWGRRRLGDGWARRLAGYVALGGVALVTDRYDIAPAACLLLAAVAMGDEAWTRAWAWSLLGAVLKLFPLAAWPILVLAEWRATGRVVWWRPAASVVLGGGLLLLPRAFGVRQITWMHFLDGRPPNIGSLAGEITALFHPFYAMYASFGSLNVIAPGMDVLAVGITALGIVAFLGVLWATWRGHLDPLPALIIGLTIMILASKVFSVQYLLWVMPLWAIYGYNRGWLMTALFNTVSYPVMFNLSAGDPLGLGRWLLMALALRNAALLLSTGRFLMAEWHARAIAPRIQALREPSA